MRMRIACLTAAFVMAAVAPSLRGQMRVTPLDAMHGHVGLGLALRHLSNTGIAMQATAHPDDENNGLLVKLSRLEGYRVALATATRGNGGQNEIGPELFEALGVLRTKELEALHRFDGVEQYFTRAVDFGYSFSAEETFDKWGLDAIIEDYVHLIRMIRPDVIFALSPTGEGGGQHHQASSLLARQAWKAAADPSKYPDQIAAGLRPWQAKKFYIAAGFGAAGTDDPDMTRIGLDTYDPLLGKTCAEIGTEARSMHKCQGMATLLSLPGPSATAYQLVESSIPGQVGRAETSLFDAIDTTIAGLAKLSGAPPSAGLTTGLAAIQARVAAAQDAFDRGRDDQTLEPLVAGLHRVRSLRAQLSALVPDASGRDEIDFRLVQKEREFEEALLQADDIRVDALGDDGVVIPGQAVRLNVIVANRGGAPVTIREVAFDGFTGAGSCVLSEATGFGGRGGRGNRGAAAAPISSLEPSGVAQCQVAATIPADERTTEPYWHRAGEAGRSIRPSGTAHAVPGTPDVRVPWR
jgi:LmbE family N-acetylglucosaminyl deacetylase